MSDDNNVSVKKQDIHDDNQQILKNNINVPILRFKDYSEEFKHYKFKELIKKSKAGGTPKSTNLTYYNGNIPFLSIKDMNNQGKFINYTEKTITKEGLENSSAWIVPKNSILYSIYASVGFIAINNINLSTSQAIYSIILKDNVDINYIYYYLQNLKKNIHKYIETGTQGNLNSKIVQNFNIKIPSLNEQKRIGNFLSLIDEKIELLEKKSNLLKEYKHGFIQKLRTGKIKFKKNDGTYYSDWKEIKLSEILFEHKLKYTGNEEVYSVSVHKGVVNQIEHLGRSFATKDLSKYKLVKPGDLIYTKSPTAGFELGIIKQNKNNKNVVVSPLYGVFTPKSKYLGNYLDAYFESSVNTRNYLHPIVQKGAKNTMNITNKVFLSKSLYLPSVLEEQKKISDSINIINQKSEKIDNNILIIKQFKKGLLQKMFV